MRALKRIREPITIRNSLGALIRGDLCYPSGEVKKPVIIVCHSFMAFKDWGFFPYVSERLVDRGFATVSFNFSRNGVERSSNRITNFTEFEINTFSHELADLEAVVTSVVQEQVGKGVIDPENVILLGHSRGGGIAILQTSLDDRVKALVTWSAISTFDRWTPHQKQKWRELGYLPLATDSTISPLRLGIGLLEDLELNRERLSIIAAATRIKVPWLIVHGRTDITVPMSESRTLYASSDKSTTELKLLDAVGHLYDAASPDEDQYKTLDSILSLTGNWLQLKIR